MATNNKPANTLRCGNIKATIWQNVSEKGPFFSTTFSRPFKDQSGTWRNGTSFGLNDLGALVSVAREAKEWIAAHVLKRSCFHGKPPVLRGLPMFRKSFYQKAEKGHCADIPSLERILPSSSRYECSPVLLNVLPDLAR